MVNRSAGGACIRLRHVIPVETKLRVQWRWEQFTGTSRWCRADGKDYLVGIQRDPEEKSGGKKEVALKGVEKKGERRAVGLRKAAEQQPEIKEMKVETVPRVGPDVPKANTAASTVAVAMQPMTASVTVTPSAGEFRRGLPIKDEGVQVLREKVKEESERHEGKDAGAERKHMRRKWFDVGNKSTSEDGLNVGMGAGAVEAVGTNGGGSVNGIPEVRAVAKESEGASSIELLSMPDIYQTAGILNPRKGYSILKVVEMLRSEHLRGLSKEMKRASVLVALDAAGVSVDEVATDAKARLEVIDSYETEQRRQFETLLARKAEENQQIMAELERIKASYADRLRRNLEGVAREKATFGNWLTTKQQETANISEALELCLKPEASEPAKDALENSLVGANAKPV